MQQLSYPKYITSDEYKLRSIIFTAMSHDIGKRNSDEEISKSDEELSEINNMLGKLSTGGNNSSEEATNNSTDFLEQGKFEISGQIVLPLPDSIIDNQSHSWGEESSILSKGLNPLLDKGASDLPIPSKARSFGLGGFINQMTIGNGITRGSNLLGIRKPVLDPSFFQTYSGSSLRGFAMIFHFIPESVEEAQTVQNIIMTFKNWTSPSIGVKNVVMLSPLYFKIEFGNPYITQMFNMNCVVCREIQVDYGADGSMQQFQDGFPKQITLTLSFIEAKLSYADNYSTPFSQQKGQSTKKDEVVEMRARGNKGGGTNVYEKIEHKTSNVTTTDVIANGNASDSMVFLS